MRKEETPAEWVDVRSDDLGDASSEEIPDDDTTVVTADSEQSSEPEMFVRLTSGEENLLKEQVTAIEIQSREPSNSSG